MKTMTLSQKLIAVIMAFGFALIMMFGFSMGANAATVSIYLQTVDRTGDTPVVSVLTTSPLTAQVSSGSTLKDAINAVSPSLSPVWSGEYLEALTYNSTTYTNATTEYEDLSGENEDPWTHGIWEGVSWMWFNDQPSAMPASQYDYPTTTLGGTEVTANTTITLSFELSSFEW